MKFNNEKSVFVPIDMQKGIVATPVSGPYTMEQVVTANNKIVAGCKGADIEVAYVNVAIDLFKYIGPNQDQTRSSDMKVPDDFTDIVIDMIEDSRVITKYTPSAFKNTNLDSLMRFKKYDTIILSGIVSTIGVYATALDAYQSGYKIIIVKDAMTDREEKLHNFFIENMYPKIAHVVTTDELLEMID